MANYKPLHKGPIMPLAIMAMFALMIPIFTIANRNNALNSASAARMRVPRKTPTPVMLEDRYSDTPATVTPKMMGY